VEGPVEVRKVVVVVALVDIELLQILQ